MYCWKLITIYFLLQKPYKLSEMPILFSVVAREDQILAKHAVCAGNFIQVTQQVGLHLFINLYPNFFYQFISIT